MVKKAAQATPNQLLRQARLEHGWTQKDVADRIGAPLNLNVNSPYQHHSNLAAFGMYLSVVTRSLPGEQNCLRRFMNSSTRITVQPLHNRKLLPDLVA